MRVCNEITGYSKILLAQGRNGSNYIKSVEIIDITNPTANCSGLALTPYELEGSIGGLDLMKRPFICGGLGASSSYANCWTYQQGKSTRTSMFRHK